MTKPIANPRPPAQRGQGRKRSRIVLQTGQAVTWFYRNPDGLLINVLDGIVEPPTHGVALAVRMSNGDRIELAQLPPLRD